MMIKRSKLFPAVAAYLLCLSCGLSAHGFRAWFVDSLVKVFPSDPAGSHRLSSADFVAARNQDVNIQVVIRSGQAISKLAARLEPLRDAAGHAIQTASIRQEGYVVVGSHTNSPSDELVGTAPGWYPDVLLPLPLDLRAHWTRSLWVEIHVPFDASPGLYRGSIRIQGGRQTLARLPFRLRVFAATVSEKRSLHVTNWFSLDDATSRQFFAVPIFSDGWWKLVGNVAHVLAEHRQNVVLTPLMQLIQARAVGGHIHYDYTYFDRWVTIFQQAGAIGTIEGSHLTTRAQNAYNGALLVPIFQIAGTQVQQIAVPADDPRVEPFLTSFLSQLYRHLEQRGWTSDYVQHISDEPHDGEIPYYAKFAEIVHRVMPGIETIDAVDVANIPESLQRNCDIWVPVLSSFDGSLNLIRRRIESGHTVWYYTCITPQGRYLNRFLDFPLIKTRLLPWLDFRYGLTGFLHWGGNYWTPKPMLDTQPVIDNNSTLLPAGDAFIYYPDRQDLTFYSSIRMETLLAGIEDYELLEALKTKNAEAAARLVKAAISSFTDYVRDPAQFRKIELQLLRAASSD
jgi:hypothetical protein